MAEEEEREPIFEFRVISDAEGAVVPEQRGPGTELQETVYMPEGEWGHGEVLGTVSIRVTGDPDDPDFVAQFSFTSAGNGPTTVAGKVPGGSAWNGKGTAKATRGGREKDVPIEFVNPKGWG